MAFWRDLRPYSEASLTAPKESPASSTLSRAGSADSIHLTEIKDQLGRCNTTDQVAFEIRMATEAAKMDCEAWWGLDGLMGNGSLSITQLAHVQTFNGDKIPLIIYHDIFIQAN